MPALETGVLVKVKRDEQLTERTVPMQRLTHGDLQKDLQALATNTLLPALAELKTELVVEMRALLRPCDSRASTFIDQIGSTSPVGRTASPCGRLGPHWTRQASGDRSNLAFLQGLVEFPAELPTINERSRASITPVAHEWRKRHFKINKSMGEVRTPRKMELLSPRSDFSVRSNSGMQPGFSEMSREFSPLEPPPIAGRGQDEASQLSSDHGLPMDQLSMHQPTEHTPAVGAHGYVPLLTADMHPDMLVQSQAQICPPPTLLVAVVRGQFFDAFFLVLVILSAIALGLETDYEAMHRGLFVPIGFELSNAFFCFAFTVELVLRLYVDRCEFFTSESNAWNIFDLVVVVLQIAEMAWSLCHKIWSSSAAAGNVTRVIRLLRTTGRLIRTVRVFRLIRLLHELRMLATSIVSSMRSLIWALMLLMLIIYIVSVFFTEVVALHNSHDPNGDSEAQAWFGTLSRSCLTLLEAITGGISWDAAVVPLMEDISPMLGILFCLYVSFCLLAVLNVVTGVFVDKATRMAQEEKEETLVTTIGNLFYHGTEDDCITWKEFSSKLSRPEMQEYFKDLNVDVSEAKGLFQLLDVDGSGGLELDEVISGCLRLRGPAKAIELALLGQEIVSLNGKVEAIERHTATIVKLLKY